MFQSWITVAGLVLDLLGFVLLLREWWLAFFHETAALEAERRRAWERSLRHTQRTHASDQLRTHLDTTARIQDEMAERNAQSRHEATLRSRKRDVRHRDGADRRRLRAADCGRPSGHALLSSRGA